jgi:hypothetical protein
VLNLDTDLFWIDDDGEVAAETSVNRTPTALLLARGDALIVTDDGGIFRWDFWRAADRLGTLGSRASSAVIARGTLYAILTNGRLVSFDLARGTLRRFPSSGSLKGAALTLLPNAELRVLGSDGVLRGYDNDGIEHESRSLDSQGVVTARATGFDLAFAPPVVDNAGTFAFAASGIPATVLQAEGSWREAANTVCDPLVSLAPAGPNRLVVACASGVIWSLSQAPVKP